MEKFYVILQVPVMSLLDDPRLIAEGIADSLDCQLAGVFAHCDIHDFLGTIFVKSSVAVCSGRIYEREE